MNQRHLSSSSPPLGQVDKTSQNSMFNPQATLLEILDPEQNTTFKEPGGWLPVAGDDGWGIPIHGWKRTPLLNWEEKDFGDVKNDFDQRFFFGKNRWIYPPIMFSGACFLLRNSWNSAAQHPGLCNHGSRCGWSQKTPDLPPTSQQDHYLNTPFDLPRPQQWHRRRITTKHYNINLGLQSAA